MHSLKQFVNFIYTDTDSIVLKNVDFYKMHSQINSLNLGSIKLEGFYDEGIFLAPKTYALKRGNTYIFKLKGIARASINKIDRDLYTFMFNNLKKPAPINISYTNLFSKNIKDFSIENQENLFQFSFHYDKRQKIYDKNDF